MLPNEPKAKRVMTTKICEGVPLYGKRCTMGNSTHTWFAALRPQ